MRGYPKIAILRLERYGLGYRDDGRFQEFNCGGLSQGNASWKRVVVVFVVRVAEALKLFYIFWEVSGI